MSNDQTVFGIDLGATYSRIARRRVRRSSLVRSMDVWLVMPSAVELGNTVTVREEAKKSAALSPASSWSVSVVKRHMGAEG